MADDPTTMRYTCAVCGVVVTVALPRTPLVCVLGECPQGHPFTVVPAPPDEGLDG